MREGPPITWPLEDWINNVAAAALSSKETVLATFDLARNCLERRIAGDFVECGVFGGVQCAMMARAIMEHYSAGFSYGCGNRRVHLFDCFEGVPAPGPHDAELMQPGVYEPFHAHTTCSLEGVKANMRQWGIPDELLVWHPGMFEDTLPALEHFPIAMLRLDGDLYESTMTCLQHLLPDVTTGGWVIVDDWGLSGARRATDEMVINEGPLMWKQQPGAMIRKRAKE